VYNAGARFVVLLLRAPEILERAERRKNGTTDPDGVFAFGRSDNLDLHARGREARELLLHAVCDAREHGRAAREDHVTIQVTTNVEVAFENRVVPVKKVSIFGQSYGNHHPRRFVNAGSLEAEERGLEESLRCAEPAQHLVELMET